MLEPDQIPEPGVASVWRRAGQAALWIIAVLVILALLI
jgi:hypothetical protein